VQVNGEQVDVGCVTELALAAVKTKLQMYLAELHGKLVEATDVDTIDKIVEESQQMAREATGAVERYLAAYIADDARQYKVIAVEVPFTVPLKDKGGRARPRISFSGVQDLVLFDPVMKDYVLGEHKSAAMDATLAEAKLDLDPQTTGYIYALKAMIADGGVQGMLTPQEARVGRILYNVVRKTGPSEPGINKDGTVSVAACDTTQAQYQKALDAQQEPAWLKKEPRVKDATKRAEALRKQQERWEELQAKQQLRLETLPQSTGRYLCRHEAYHNPAAIERWRHETLSEASLLRAALKGQLAITRNPSQCNMPWSPRCPYRTVCIEDAPELRSEFRVVSDPHVEVVAAEEEQLA
jgi:hypothetical protein